MNACLQQKGEFINHSVYLQDVTGNCGATVEDTA